MKSFFGLELNVLKDEIKTPKAPRKDPASSELIKVNMGNSFLNKFFPLYAPRKLAQALYSGQLDGKRFFGVYATGDKDGEKFAGQYEKAHSMGLDRFIGKFKGTPITPDMVRNSAHKYKVDPYMVAVVMANDSSMGTKGMGARNRNPGNVAQFDHLKNAVA